LLIYTFYKQPAKNWGLIEISIIFVFESFYRAFQGPLKVFWQLALVDMYNSYKYPLIQI